MENPIYDDGYEAIKREAKKAYDKIDRVWCPALNDYVAFRKAGFRHLIWKGPAPRLKSEQKRRFTLLPYVEKILQNPNNSVIYKSEGDAKFWGFTDRQNERIIRVVLRQIGEGEKHFFSVFEDKQKSTQ